MAHNSRLNVCLATTTRIHSKIRWRKVDEITSTSPIHGRDPGRSRALAPFDGSVRPVQTRRLSGRLAINPALPYMGVELHR